MAFELLIPCALSVGALISFNRLANNAAIDLDGLDHAVLDDHIEPGGSGI